MNIQQLMNTIKVVEKNMMLMKNKTNIHNNDGDESAQVRRINYGDKGNAKLTKKFSFHSSLKHFKTSCKKIIC